MKEIKEIIAENITKLRKQKKWTQLELSEKIHYSDKAVSKWERGESSPDVDSLYKLSEIFGVSVDYFFQEQKESKWKYLSRKRYDLRNSILILALLCTAILFIAVVVLVAAYYKDPNSISYTWISFLYCLPIWGVMCGCFFIKFKEYKIGQLISFSAVLWSLLTVIYLQLLFDNNNVWMLFLVGIPLQLAIWVVWMLSKKS